MSLTPSIIIRQAYARIGAWQGNSQEINAQYNADVNFEQVVTESFPPQLMYDMLIGIENEMSVAIAMNPDNVLRRRISDTATVTSGSTVSYISDGGFLIIGEWGQVRDADTGIPLTPGMNEDEIIAISNGPTGLFKSTTHSYAVRKPRIYATVTNLEIDVCVFDFTLGAARMNANGAVLFEQCQDAYFYGLMANLKNQDPAYTSLSNEYAPMYAQWLAVQSNRPPNGLAEQAKA